MCLFQHISDHLKFTYIMKETILRLLKVVTFKAFLRVGIQVVGLRNCFDHFLDDNAVVNARVACVYFNVIVAGQCGHLDGFFGRRFELLPFDAQFLHAIAVQLFQQTHDSCLFAGTIWSIHKQMRKII